MLLCTDTTWYLIVITLPLAVIVIFAAVVVMKNKTILRWIGSVKYGEWKKHTARYRQEFMQSITALSLAYSNDNHMRAIKNDPLPVCSSQATLGLNRTIQWQYAAWTRRFPSRSRKPAATASWKQNRNRNSWKCRRSKFEVTRQMQKNTSHT